MLLSISLGVIFALAILAHPFSESSNLHLEQQYGRRHYQESDKRGAVASESAVCSRIGIDLLKAGGNAADAVSNYIKIKIIFEKKRNHQADNNIGV